MPFCRKCGRRLVQYSQSCPDCGTSTTAPLINLKKSTGAVHNFKAAAPKKITKALIPQQTNITIQKITQTSPIKKLQTEITKITITRPQNQTQTKKTLTTLQAKIPSPKKVTSSTPFTAPKPVLSAKHIIKLKKAKPSKPTALFNIAHPRPTAIFTALQTKPIASPKTLLQVTPVEKSKSINLTSAVATSSKIPPTPIVPQTKPQPQPKPITPAPTYPPHEIIKSKTSIKNDFLTNPQDYEKQIFNIDLECPNRHFWPEGTELPISKGRALCPKCGEQLRKPKPKKRFRHRKSAFSVTF